MTAVIPDTTKNALLDSAVSGGLVTSGTHLAAFTSFPPAIGGNEVNGGSPAYARKAITWGASSAGAKAIAASQTFDVPAGTTIRAIGVCSALTAGSLIAWSPAGASTRRAMSVTDSTDVTNNDIWSPAHGLTTGDRVLFWATIGASLPGGLAEDTEYFVIAAGLTTDSFRVSTTSGGSAVDITSIGDGDVQKFVAEVFAGQGTYQATAFSVALPG